MVALDWLSDDQVSAPSYRARGAAMLLATLRTHCNVSIARTHIHLPKELNTRADALSRNFDLEPTLSVPVHRATDHPLMIRLLDLCNPLTHPNDESEYIQRWSAIQLTCDTELPRVATSTPQR